MHVSVADVASLIETSEILVEKAAAAFNGSASSMSALHKAEQIRLLMRWQQIQALGGASSLRSDSATSTEEY
jgi:hypothetical protein